MCLAPPLAVHVVASCCSVQRSTDADIQEDKKTLVDGSSSTKYLNLPAHRFISSSGRRRRLGVEIWRWGPRQFTLWQ